MAVGQGYQGNLDAIVEALSPQSGTGDFIDDFRGKLLDDSSQAWHDFQKSNGGTALMSHNTGVPRPEDKQEGFKYIEFLNSALGKFLGELGIVHENVNEYLNDGGLEKIQEGMILEVPDVPLDEGVYGEQGPENEGIYGSTPFPQRKEGHLGGTLNMSYQTPSTQTGVGEFIDDFRGTSPLLGESLNALEEYQKSSGEIKDPALVPHQYYDPERGGFVSVHGSMTPQYTNKFAEIIDQTPIGTLADFAMIPEGWRGKVDPYTGRTKPMTVEEGVSMAQSALGPPAWATKGLISGALPVAMAPLWWQGAARAFKGQPSTEFVGSAKRGLAFGWGQYFSDRRGIAGGYTKAPEFKARSTVYDIDKFETATSPQKGHYEMVDMGALATELVENYRTVGKMITDLTVTNTKEGGMKVDEGGVWRIGGPKLKDDLQYQKLRKNFKEIEDQMSSVMFMRMDGDNWEVALRDSFQHGKPDRHGAYADKGDLSEEEVDRIINEGRKIWATVEQTAGGKTTQWDVADSLVGETGEKLLDWNAQFKDYPKPLQNKILRALKDLSQNPNYSKITINQRIDRIVEKLHGQGAGFVDQTGRKYRPKPLTEEMIKKDFLDVMTGEQIYNMVRSDIPIGQSKGSWAGLEEAAKQASLYMSGFGIPGLRYQAGSLSGKPTTKVWNADRTRNYVIWDQKLLDKMERKAEF